MLTTTIWGGAGEHGRSCYHVENSGISVLLDCGVKKSGVGEYPFIDASRIRDLSAVFLSHAHEDHSVGIPLLVELGYRGDVWTTRATISQLPGYFELWRKHVERLGGELPYDAETVGRIRYRCLEDAAAAGTWFEAVPGVQACWGPSGHLPGSVWLLLDIGGKLLYYSGDYTSESSLLRADLPHLQDGKSPDLAIIDAAYGDRGDVQEREVSRLVMKIREVSDRRGHVMMPVPLYGRGQELLTVVAERMPDASIICESKLLQGFHDLTRYSEWLWSDSGDRIRDALHRTRFIYTEEDRAAAIAGPPSIIFTSDGLLETPIAQTYYHRLSHDARHAVLFTGHLYEGSFGAKVYEAYRRECGVQPNMNARQAVVVSGNCEIMQFHYKIHQGLPDVIRMLQRIRPKQALLVHASKEQTDQLCDRLSAQGFTGLHSLTPGDQVQA